MELDGEHGIKGFLPKLLEIPAEVVELKQRRIEAVRHLLLYDMTGSQTDAFSAALRELLMQLKLHDKRAQFIRHVLSRERTLVPLLA